MMRHWLVFGSVAASCLAGFAGASSPTANDITTTWGTVDGEMNRLSTLVTSLSNNNFSTVTERNQFVLNSREIGQCADDTATVLTTHVLQQSLSPGDPAIDTKLKSIHKILWTLQQVKDNPDTGTCETLASEWQQFKILWQLPETSTPSALESTNTENATPASEDSDTSSNDDATQDASDVLYSGVSITLKGKIGTIVAAPITAPAAAPQPSTTPSSAATTAPETPTATSSQAPAATDKDTAALEQARDKAIARARERARARSRAQKEMVTQRGTSRSAATAVTDLGAPTQKKGNLAQIPELAR